MCCFSQAVEYVAGTNIFARPLVEGRQVLVYSMSFAAAGDLAMILPLPVPPSPPEDAVRFVNLEAYPEFFTDMRKAFPMELVATTRGGLVQSGALSHELVVHDVGDFEASFVPELADFERLDRRFKLAPEVWEQLPQYRDWGFAVFKLKQESPGFFERLLRRPGKKKTVHPMAFEFPRRDPASLFFPTMHVHDGEVHETARFDHTFYCQPDALTSSTFSWERSAGALGQYIDDERSAGLVDGSRACFKTTLMGTLPNRDLDIAPPVFGDASGLLRRGRCFELRLCARFHYVSDESPRQSEHAAWKANASKNLEPLGEQLHSEVSAALADRQAELGLRDYDEGLIRCGHTNGSLYPQRMDDDYRFFPDPKEGEPLLLELSVSDDRVEPQHLRLAFTSPPSPERIAVVQQVLDGALARVSLP